MKEVEANKSMGYAITRINYLMIIAGFIVIIIGFALMSGGKSTDVNVFSEEIFSRRRITIAPIVVLAGFIFEIFAIMYRPKNK